MPSLRTTRTSTRLPGRTELYFVDVVDAPGLLDPEHAVDEILVFQPLIVHNPEENATVFAQDPKNDMVERCPVSALLWQEGGFLRIRQRDSFLKNPP